MYLLKTDFMRVEITSLKKGDYQILRGKSGSFLNQEFKKREELKKLK